jgi:hypothetical protein
MNQIFQAHLKKFVLVFFDDILIYNNSLQDHLAHIKEVLTILRDNSLTTKMSKCTFATDKIEYLGHIIDVKGVATDPAKVKTIQSWAIPKTITQLRGFMGLTGYYRRLIKNYGLIYRPLHDLLKKDSFH